MKVERREGRCKEKLNNYWTLSLVDKNKTDQIKDNVSSLSSSSHSRSFNFDPFYSVHKYIDPKWLA